MKGILLFIFSIICGFTVIYFFAKPFIPSSADEEKIKSPVSSFFSLEEPPSQSLRGNLSSVTGEIKLQTRLATEPASLVSQRDMKQGELIATGKESTARIEFKNGAEVNIQSESALEFMQTLPEHIVISQKSGSATYQTGDTAAVSVRILQVLIVLNSHTEVEVSRDGPEVNIRVMKGSVKAGYNDIDNVSTVVPIKSGEVFVYSADTREGEIQTQE